MAINAPLLKYPGSKFTIAPWIVSNFPEHGTYLEPYFGGGSVLFNKEPSTLETINDLNGDIANLFKVIRDFPEKLARFVNFTPWSRDEYYLSYEKTGDSVEDARRFLVRMWQAFGAKSSDRCGWRNSINAKGPDNPALWSRLPEQIIYFAQRLRAVQIENQPAIKLIKRYKQPGVLIYADPPYPLSTRSGRMYKHEMTDADHEELLVVLNEHPGPVLLSSYPCELYKNQLKHWTVKTKTAQAEGGRQRQELLWINPVAVKLLNNTLF